MIVGSPHVRPFHEGTWGGWIQGGVLLHTRHLEEQGALVPSQVACVENIMGRGALILHLVIPTLLRNDPRPWNTVVRTSSEMVPSVTEDQIGRYSNA